MNFENLTLPDLENFFTNSQCNCHFIDCHKTRILMWKQVQANQETYFLRIGIQRFVAQKQVDRNGETYWRYWNLTHPEKTAPHQVSEQVAKFNQRQAKTKAYESHNNLSEPVNSEPNQSG